MMNRIYVTIFLLLMVCPCLMASPDSLYQAGNQYYHTGQYEEALNAYQSILEQGFISGSVYYNIGNCYYKLQNIGMAILNYERAKRLLSGDDDLDANLTLANMNVVDKIEPAPEFFLSRFVHGFFFLLPKSTMQILLFIIYFSGMVTLILSIILRKRWLRFIFKRIFLILSILFLIILAAWFGKLYIEKNTIEGVILETKVDVMSAPSFRGGEEIFTLHEGTKVRLDQEVGDWVEIVLADRKVGWVEKRVLGII